MREVEWGGVSSEETNVIRNSWWSIYCRLDGLLPGRQCAGGSASLYPPVGGLEKLLLLTVLVPLAVRTVRTLYHRAGVMQDAWMKGRCTSALPYL